MVVNYSKLHNAKLFSLASNVSTLVCFLICPIRVQLRGLLFFSFQHLLNRTLAVINHQWWHL